MITVKGVGEAYKEIFDFIKEEELYPFPVAVAILFCSREVINLMAPTDNVWEAMRFVHKCLVTEYKPQPDNYPTLFTDAAKHDPKSFIKTVIRLGEILDEKQFEPDEAFSFLLAVFRKLVIVFPEKEFYNILAMYEDVMRSVR